MLNFNFASASMTGRDHVGRNGVLLGKNNQDALAFRETETTLVAVICDGCSEGAHSEVGAKLAAKWLAGQISLKLAEKEEFQTWDSFFAGIHTEMLSWLRGLTSQFAVSGESSYQFLRDYLMFTVTGALIQGDKLVIFSIGDGMYAVNGCETDLGPFENNEPPYLVYALSEKLSEKHPACKSFSLVVSKLDTVESFLIGSDGVRFLTAAAEKKMPGRDALVGSLKDLTGDGAIFENSDLLRRRLALINREVAIPFPKRPGLQIETGLLADDTTLFVAQRKATQEIEKCEEQLK